MTGCGWGRATWCHHSTPQLESRKRRAWVPVLWPWSCSSSWWASSWASWSCRWKRGPAGHSMLSEEEVSECSIWDFGSEYAISTELRRGEGGGKGGTRFDSVSFTVCLKQANNNNKKNNYKIMFEEKNLKRIERLTNKSTVTGLASL